MWKKKPTSELLDDSIAITFSNDKIIEMETISVVARGSEGVRGGQGQGSGCDCMRRPL